MRRFSWEACVKLIPQPACAADFHGSSAKAPQTRLSRILGANANAKGGCAWTRNAFWMSMASAGNTTFPCASVLTSMAGPAIAIHSEAPSRLPKGLPSNRANGTRVSAISRKSRPLSPVRFSSSLSLLRSRLRISKASAAGKGAPGGGRLRYARSSSRERTANSAASASCS